MLESELLPKLKRWEEISSMLDLLSSEKSKIESELMSVLKTYRWTEWKNDRGGYRFWIDESENYYIDERKLSVLLTKEDFSSVQKWYNEHFLVIRTPSLKQKSKNKVIR